MKLRQKLAFARSVFRYQLHKKPCPIAIAWLITGRCHGSCSYCRWKQLRQSAELSTEQALDLIDQMALANVQLISFTGGEPLLRDDIGRLVDRAKRHGMIVKLNTSGHLFRKRIFCLRGLDLLQISLDGPPEEHDSLRGKGSAQKAIEAIRLAKENHIPVQIVACLTSSNATNLGVVKLAEELGVRVHFQPLAPTPNADGGPWLLENHSQSGALEKLIEIKRKKGPAGRAIGTSIAELEYYLLLTKELSPGCHCALITATILPDGQMIFCGNAKNPTAFSTTELGFSEAFKRLQIPDCDGCTCVGKLRISKVFNLDASVLLDLWDS